MPFIILGIFVLVALFLAQYSIIRYAINNSEATRLLTEIKVLLMESQNKNSGKDK